MGVIDSVTGVHYNARMVWYLDVPWDRIIIGVSLFVYAIFIFREHLIAYERIYFPARAVSQAALKTAYWVACYGLSFVAVYLVVSRFWPAGGLRYLIGAGSWWVVASLLNELAWKPLSHLIDKLMD